MTPRPTRTGALVLGLAAAFGAIGSLLHYPELIAAAATLTAVVLGGAGWALTTARPLAARLSLPVDRVADGSEVTGTVTVTNAGRRRRAGSVVLPLAAAPVVLPVAGALPAGGTTTAEVRLPALPRGRYRLGPPSVVSTDPFGLVSVRRATGSPTDLWVHPRVHGVRRRRAERGLRTGLQLQEASPDGTDLHRLDDYHPGDDPRLIHWATSLRRGTLTVRHPARDQQREVLVVLDTAAASYADADQFEHAVVTAASILMGLAADRGTAMFATTTGQRVAVGASARRRTALLDELAGLRPTTGDGGLAGVALTSKRRLVPVVAVTGPDGPAALVDRLDRRAQSLTLLRVAGGDGSADGGRHHEQSGALVISAATSAELVRAWSTA